MKPLEPEIILVATDLSAPSDEAILQAHERALAAGSRLFVCHVIPNPLRSDPLFPQEQLQDILKLPELVERVTAEIIDRVTRVTGRDPGQFHVQVVDGIPYAEIVQAAEQLEASLLVIGSHGRTGLDRVLLGSIAEKVARHAHGPVLVARPRRQRGRVLVATDLSDPSLPAIAAGIREAKRLGAKLTFLHCIDMTAIGYEGGAVLGGIPYVPPMETFEEMTEAAETQLAMAIESLGGQGDRRIEVGPPTSVIVRTAADLGVELVVIGTIGRTGLRRALLGSVAEGVVRAAGSSVLIVRKHAVEQQ